MIIIGIDPGASGAIAVFDPSIGSLAIHDMPTLDVIRNGKNKTEISPRLVADIICAAAGPDPVMAVVERVGAMPGQGVSSMFQFGRSVGIIEGVLGSLSVPMTALTPQVWQKLAGVRGGKDAARLRAIEIFPAYAQAFARKKDDGRADAALIAWVGATS
jgi:crossover junction endodeoxyribonuclease RuvC